MIRAAGDVLAGVLFGAGLLVSGMTDPLAIRAFLDVGGDWDPALAAVMAAAVVSHAVTRRPWAGPVNPGPVDLRLTSGGALFGAGWGWVGYCPGPAVVAFAAGSHEAGGFLLGMCVGFVVYEALEALSMIGPMAPNPTLGASGGGEP